MEKLYDCKILQDTIHRSDVGGAKYNICATAGLEEEINFTPPHILDYTKLYRKFKEKNLVKSHNKLPVHAYRYPRNFKNANFEDLKKEVICEEQNNADAEAVNNVVKKNLLNYYEGNLQILLPTKVANEENAIKESKKSLRRKIYDGEMIFYEDYLEQVAARDYEYFFGRPYEIQRKDEGGKYYVYGKKMHMDEFEDIYRKFYNMDDEYFIRQSYLREKNNKNEKKNLEKIKRQNDEKILDKECEKLSYTDRKFILKIKEEIKSKNLNTYTFYKKNKNIFEKDMPEIKKKELLYGQIPDIILPANVRKIKHPKNCVVSLSSLHTYAKYIDDMLKCPFIYTAIDAELGKYWKTNENEVINNIKSEKIKKGYKEDIYSATKEQLQISSAKMKNLIKNEKMDSVNNTSLALTFKYTFYNKEEHPNNRNLGSNIDTCYLGESTL
ncbi:hypothetical protein, conserved [Plasmodium ovale curtisi]|uniref:Apical exonemal protein n=1 Tax=Plasmodium ovale curtisi TaxID=864141 RepID=A0A1A8VX27_PLAOA|nr:hypothetical protein, conserved [Plasmodium ovale curtisi]